MKTFYQIFSIYSTFTILAHQEGFAGSCTVLTQQKKFECRPDCSSKTVFKLYTDTFSLKVHATATAGMLMDILVILCHDFGMSCLKLIF